MSLSIEYIVRYSTNAGKIGTLATRVLSLVENIEAPDIEYDEARAVSMDKKTVQRTVVASSETVKVTYVFPVAELELDDEFRRSAIGSNDSIEIDCTDYPWINRILVVSMNSGSITGSTVTIRGNHIRRSFEALVIDSQ